MDPISNADRLVLLLRQKLLERSKVSSGRRTGVKEGADRDRPAEAVGLQALQAIEGVDERLLRQAFVQNLLVEQFGSALINDAQFQQIVTRVTETIEEDPDASRLLSRVLSDLRSA